MTAKRSAPGSFLKLAISLASGLVLALVLVCAISRHTAHANGLGTTITVNSTIDQNESNNIPGDCSLREAIQAANTDTAVDACPAGNGEDIILVPVGVYTLALAGNGVDDANLDGDLDILDSVTIQGTGAVSDTVIDGNNSGRIFHIHTGAIVTLENLSLTHGATQDGLHFCDGGGIYNNGTLTLAHSAVVNNSSMGFCDDYTRYGNGGGIYNGGTLVLINSQVSNNDTGYAWLGDAGEGGGIYSTGPMTILNSIVMANSTAAGCSSQQALYYGNGGRGGGIYSSNISYLENSVISNNATGEGGSDLNNAISPGGKGGDGGGIYSSGLTQLVNTQVSGNATGYGGQGFYHDSGFCLEAGSGGDGGGIFNSGILEISQRSSVSYNVTGDGGDAPPYDLLYCHGASAGFGGGIYSTGVVTISHTNVISNLTGTGGSSIHGFGGLGGSGGGIHSGPGSVLTIGHSQITGNRAGDGGYANQHSSGGSGGGISSEGKLYIYNSTLADNRAGNPDSSAVEFLGGNGGGIYLEGTGSLTNCTLGGNQTGKASVTSPLPDQGIGGGGVYISHNSALTLTACTVTKNRSLGMSSTSQGGGIFAVAGSSVILVNSIIAKNADQDGQSPDCRGALNSFGYNLIGSNTGCTFVAQTSDQVGNSTDPIDPLLSLRANYGGSTPIHALLPGSPAIDTGICTDTQGASLTTDQRDVPRPYDGNADGSAACDIGSFELDPVAPTFTSRPDTIALTDQTYTYDITAIDANPGEILTITAPVLPFWLSLVDNGDGTALLSGTPGTSDIGEQPVSLFVVDSTALTSTQDFTITVSTTGIPDLSLSRKFVNRASFDTGDILTYTIVLHNRSDMSAEAQLVDQIPQHTTYLGGATASNGGTVNQIAGYLHWSGPVLQGTPVLIRFAVQVDTAGMLPGDLIKNFAALGDGAGHQRLLSAASTFNPGYSLSINDGALYTNVPTVTLRYAYNASDNIVEVKFSNDGGFGTGSSSWLPVSSGPTYEGWLLTTYGDQRIPRTVYAKFRDAAGNPFGPVADDIIYDPVPPPAPDVVVGKKDKTSLLSLTATEPVTLVVTATDDNSGVSFVEVSGSASFFPSSLYTVTAETTVIPWVMGEEGVAYLRAIDRAGNASEPTAVRTTYFVYVPVVVRNK